MGSKISVYIPCYNGANFLPGCIASLKEQTRPPDEIIVVDDGSTDGSGGVARRLGARVLEQSTNQGLGAGRNRAIEEAEFDLVASLDADCIAAPDWLAELEKAMEVDGRKKLAGVGGSLTEGFQKTIPDAWRTSHMPQHFGENLLRNPPFLFGNNNLYRREAIKIVGGYDKNLRTNYEDVDIGHRLQENGYALLYHPSANVTHQRRDNVRRVLNAYWRWTLWDYSEPTNFGIATRKLYFNFRKSASFLRKDYRARAFRLMSLDMLMFMVHTYWDFKHAMIGRHQHKRDNAVSQQDEEGR